MLVRSKSMIFRNGRRYRVDQATGLTDPFEMEVRKDKKLPDNYVPAETTSVVKKDETPITFKSRKQIVALLHLAGVPVNQGATTDELGKQLEDVQKNASPGTTGRDKSEEIESGKVDQSRDDVRAQLRDKGIPFKATASRDELLAMLDSSTKGVGDQDVI
jgi:hypothetical protein